MAPMFPVLASAGLWRATPPVSLVLEVEHASISRVLSGLAPLVVGGQELRVVDADGSFDPYVFAVCARRRGRLEAEVLERVLLTRAFTIHQLEAVVAELLPPLASRAAPPLIAVLGLDHLFLEETLPLGERRQVLGRVAGHLRRLHARGVRLLVTHAPASAGGAAWWRPLVGSVGTCRGAVCRGARGGLDLWLEGR
jgi:hypothetical protein